MAQTLQITQLFDWLDKPAFMVEDGLVSRVNGAAEKRNILPGTPVAQLLCSGAEEYNNFTQGSLYLTLEVGGVVLDACVHQVEDCRIFVLEQANSLPQLQALAQASGHLRFPLNEIISAAERLCGILPPDSDELTALVGSMNKSLNQLHRMVGNMSDAYLYHSGSLVQPQLRELCGFLSEIFEKAASLCAHAGVTVEFTAPREDIFCLFDPEMLERAVHNMLSNALKFTPAGGSIHAVLLRRQNRVLLSVEDTGRGIAPEVRSSVYTRYMRPPELEERLQGPGLGMSLICSAARHHGGTVLLEQPREGGTKITVTFPIRQDAGTVRTPTVLIDYAGERDHALLELSDALPSELFEH